jgi:DNA-binding response OmpR family regulator
MAKILIIEDEKALIKNLELALEEDYEILSAITGQEGLRKAKKEKPDLILLDVMLPDMDGMEVLKNLRIDEETDDIPIIVLTNLGDKETISRIIQSGGKEYLVKADWSIDDIVNKIKTTL